MKKQNQQSIDEALNNAITALGQCQKGTARQFLQSAIDAATAEVKKEELGSDTICPFCHETDFDIVGLKQHIENGWCDKYRAITIDP